MPVWSKHFGHGTPLDRLPAVDKPLMVGESGGTYYARPKQMAEFNGPRLRELRRPQRGAGDGCL